MDDFNSFNIADLERCTYRYLQQKAKAMHLPSNVKKVYLIEMIYAKRYNPLEVDEIIKRVKQERLHKSMLKRVNQRKTVQDAEISSTSQSPPIAMTPKRIGPLFVRYSPEPNGNYSTYKRKLNKVNTPKKTCGSDRVLRSSNIKTRKSNHRVLNSVISVINADNETYEDERIAMKDKNTKSSNSLVKKQCPIAPNKHSKNPVLYKQNLKADSHFPMFSLPRICLKNDIRMHKSLSNVQFNTSDTRTNYPIVFSVNKTKEDVSTSNTLVDSSLSKVDNRVQLSNSKTQENARFVSANISTYKNSSTQTKQSIMKINIESRPIFRQGMSLFNLSKPRLLSSPLNPDAFRINYIENIDISTQRNVVDTPSTFLDSQMPLFNASSPVTDANDFNQLEYRGIDGNLAEVSDLVAESSQTLNNDDNADGRRVLNINNLTDVSNDYAVNAAPADVKPRENSVGSRDKEESFSVVCNKKTIEELPKKKREAETGKLPMITAVFSKFNKDLTQPLYVQVSEESERFPVSLPMLTKNQVNTCLLEKFYNFKTQFLTNQPLLKLATTSNTVCVQSTPLITTPVQQTSLLFNQQNINMFVPDKQFANIEKIDDAANITVPNNFTVNEDSQCTNLSQSFDDANIAEQSDFTQPEELSPSSLENLSKLDPNVSIPEMVEDAMEIISQDGDYIERIGMDVRMQCILCNWAGPRIILDYHIRKEHPDQIQKQTKKEWVVTYSLGHLVHNDVWTNEIVDFDSNLYIISVKYLDPDTFMATICNLDPDIEPTKASITIYNKVTGEPNTWEGEIQTLPPNMPYDNNTAKCLKLELSKINLMPNSANLTLRNREFVSQSTGKVVVKRPELNDIHIILFVKLY